jgi:hypothetical protein
VIRSRAIAAYRVCLARAIELEYSNEFSRMCEEQLEAIDDETVAGPYTSQSPAIHELLDDELVTSARIEQLGVLADPD